MPITNIENFRGGLSLVEPSNLEDNQFEVLKNLYYNKDKRIQTRRWISNFWGVVPSNTILINACDATTNFAVADDATTLATWTAIRWTNSVSFMIDVSNSGNDYANLTNASLGTIDISDNKWHLAFWLYVPAAFNTNLTAVKLRLWSDSSNYYEWTLSTLTEASNNFIKLDYDDATETWTVTDTSIDYMRLQVTYDGSYTDKSWILIDSIYSYWSISTTPITSYFFFQNDTDATRTAICTSWTYMFLYNETTEAWETIKTWLTEFETDNTTRTRWSFAVYLNKIYMCNGIDDYTEWNWTTFSDQASQPKVRYLRYMADSIYWAGQDTNPSTIYATTAWAVDAKTLDANDIKVWWDELWRINWLLDLWNVLMVWKNKKIYSVAGDLASSQAIDSQNWGYCNRAIHNVENAIMYYNDAWVDRVKARNGVTWAAAMASEPLANDLRDLLDNIDAAQRNNNAGSYIDFLNNYYFSFDTGNDSIPDTTLIYSSLVWAWSQYLYPALYDYGFYIDSSWVYHYLIASANGWQMYEIENGFQDFWLAIESELQTKTWDFWDAGTWKTFDAIDIVWLKNEWAEIKVEIIVDDEVVATSIIDDDFIDANTASLTIWSREIGTLPVWWWSWSDTEIDLFNYLIRIPLYSSGSNIKIRMYSNSNPNVWSMDKIKISRENEVIDLFPTANIW